MSDYDNPTFAKSLSVQVRVIGALMRRELITFYGRKGFGFISILLEPLILMSLVMVSAALHHSTMGGRVSFPVKGFILSGWGVMWTCRYALRKALPALFANRGFLYHNNIKPIDILISRNLVLLWAIATSFWLLFALYLVFLAEGPLNSLLHILLGFLLLYWYCFFMAIFLATIQGYLPMGYWVARGLAIANVWACGALFMVTWLPKGVQTAVLLIPLVHITEMIRYGMFGNIVVCTFDIGYVVTCNVLVMFFGLTFFNMFSRSRDFYDNPE
jgi:capsular polysaccharide transport system permease protein